MLILINDANILIDLIRLELTSEFTELPFKLKTTDFVFEELYEEQRNSIQEFIDTNKLEIITTEKEEDFNGISQLLDKTTGLSFEDCLVWYYANKLTGILLSGDGKLRKQASADGLTVKGILYIFDELLVKTLITPEIAVRKLLELENNNPRLPKEAINERIAKWSSEITSMN